MGNYRIAAVWTAGVLTWAWATAARWLLGIDAEPESVGRWHFSLVEIFGWTNVVGIAVAAERSARFEHLLSDPVAAAQHLALAATIGGVTALTLGDFRQIWPDCWIECGWLGLFALLMPAVTQNPASFGGAVGVCRAPLACVIVWRLEGGDAVRRPRALA